MCAGVRGISEIGCRAAHEKQTHQRKGIHAPPRPFSPGLQLPVHWFGRHLLVGGVVVVVVLWRWNGGGGVVNGLVDNNGEMLSTLVSLRGG